MKTAAVEFLANYNIFLSATVARNTNPAMQAQFTADQVNDLLNGEAFCDSGHDENVCFFFFMH